MYTYTAKSRNTPWTYMRIYVQRTDLMGLYSGGGLIFGRKNTSICNLLNLLFFLFSSIKHVFRHFSRRARCEICSKLTIMTPEYVKLTIKLKIKTRCLFIVNFEHISLLVTVFLLLTLIS